MRIPVNPTKAIPGKFKVEAFYPNPFNSTTRLDFYVPITGSISIDLFDITGRKSAKLVNDEFISGNHTLILNGNDLSTGVYFVRVQSQGFNTVQKVVLIR